MRSVLPTSAPGKNAVILDGNWDRVPRLCPDCDRPLLRLVSQSCAGCALARALRLSPAGNVRTIA